MMGAADYRAMIRFVKISMFICAMLQNVYATTRDGFQLELLQVVFRHGERTPLLTEAELISGIDASLVHGRWGAAQLTNEGKRQEFRLGSMLRHRYGDFLGADFHPDHVYARSSGFDRTKASLELVLAALYPPTSKLMWNHRLSWNPIPIDAVPADLDPLFYLYLCPEFVKLWNELMNTEEMKSKVRQFDDLFKFLHEKYPSIDFDVDRLFRIDNLLQIQRKLKVPMPSWYTAELHARIHAGTLLYFDSMSYTPALTRLNGGGLARRLVENVLRQKSMRKLYLYSGHEFTLDALARTHGIKLDKQPSFGSAIILEKWRDAGGEVYMKMHEWTGVTEKLVELKLQNCEEYCLVDDYISIVKPSLATDDDMLCLFKNKNATELQKLLDPQT